MGVSPRAGSQNPHPEGRGTVTEQQSQSVASAESHATLTSVVRITRRAAIAALTAAPLFSAERKIRVGCQTRAYGSPLTDRDKLLAVLDDLEAAGYEGFETNYRSLEAHFNNPAPMRAEIERRGVGLIGLHLGAGLFDPANIEAERELLFRVARGTKALGGDHVIMSGRELPVRADGSVEPAALAAKIREANRLGRELAEMGVRFAIHNHQHEVAHDGAELRELLAATETSVSLLFDVGHVLHHEMDVPNFIREQGDRIAGLHLRDVGGGKEVLIGTGEVQFSAIADALCETAWQGWLILELNEHGGLSSRDLVERARGHVRKRMGV